MMDDHLDGERADRMAVQWVVLTAVRKADMMAAYLDAQLVA